MPISTSSQFDLVAQLPLRLYGTVANITARDAIPTSRRHDGFETYVISESSTYRLQGGITNTDWVLSTSASTDQYLSGVIVNSISDVDFVITHGTNIEGIDFSHTHPWSQITSTPTTESGYGITDGFTSWDKDYDDLINKPNIAYASTIGIGDLDDVDTNGIINDKILKYNSTSGNWEIADDNNTTYVSSDFDHNALINTHNLTTDIDHTSITNIGINTHAQIDSHISDSSIHFSDLSGFDTDDLAEGSTNLYSQWGNITGGIQYIGGDVKITTGYYYEQGKRIATQEYVTGLNISTFNNDIGYLTAETDTLDSVTGRGASTTNILTVGGLTVTNDVNIGGNLTVTGTQFIANVETVEIADNLAIINAGETGAGITAGFAGWEADRGTLSNYRWGYDETRDLWVLGEVGSTLQAVATRQDSPINGYFAQWNSTYNRFDAVSKNTVNYWQQSGSDIYYNVGRVGIGTATSPVRTLEVNSGATNAVARFVSNDSIAELELLDINTTIITTLQRVGDNLNLVPNGGNVGIGKNNPSYKLDVNGTGRFEDKLYLGTSTAPATDTGTLNALVYDPSNGEVKQRAISGGSGVTIGNTGQVPYSNTGTPGTDFNYSASFSWDTVRLLINSGDRNTFIGTNTAKSITDGVQNVIIGHEAGYGLTGADYNVIIGRQAGYTISTGQRNTSIGHQSNYLNSTGNDNTSFGYQAGYSITGGSNVCIGSFSGLGITSGNGNTCIGRNTGSHIAAADYNVFLGYNAGSRETGSNKLYIDNKSYISEALAREGALIYGEFNSTVSSQLLRVNGNLNIKHNLDHDGTNIGFFGTTPVAKQTALTAASTNTVDTTYGTEEATVINNLRTRLNELETKLQAYGLLT